MLELSIYIGIGIIVLFFMVMIAPKQAKEAYRISYFIIILLWPIILGWLIIEMIRLHK